MTPRHCRRFDEPSVCCAFLRRRPPTPIGAGLGHMGSRERLDDFGDHGLFVLREVHGALECGPEAVLDQSSHVVSEHQGIGADRESHRKTSQYVQGGLGGSCLVTMELRWVDAGTLGQHGLGEIAFAAQCSQPLSEVHEGTLLVSSA